MLSGVSRHAAPVQPHSHETHSHADAIPRGQEEGIGAALADKQAGGREPSDAEKALQDLERHSFVHLF